MPNTYLREECFLCGQYTSSNGLAKTAHMRMHVREGYLTQTGGSGTPVQFWRTDKSFDREAYQKQHPDRAYEFDDWFPIYDNPGDIEARKQHIKEMVERKAQQ